MAKTRKYRGLCETCDHDRTCTLRRSSVLEIIQCEEFSAHQASHSSKPRQTPIPQAESYDAASLGLCANCLYVVTCGFPQARQRVMQCEEYAFDEGGAVPAVQERPKSAA